MVCAAAASPSAHRRDEYLQAARLAIDPDRVRIDLDLTPGIAVADRILTDIDTDRNGSLSSLETQAYVRQVAGAITLDVDGSRLAVQGTDSAFPTFDAVRNGEGTIRLRLEASAPSLSPGVHQLRYHNGYRPDVGVYLANALVPDSRRVAVTGQERDVDQRDLRVAFLLHAESPRLAGRRMLISITGALLGLAMLWQVRLLRSSDLPL